MKILRFFYNTIIELVTTTAGVFWGIFLAIIICLIIYLTDKYISEELIPYIMYPSIIFVIVVGFLFPKKIDRFFLYFYGKKNIKQNIKQIKIRMPNKIDIQ